MKIASLRISIATGIFLCFFGCAQRFDQVILLPLSNNRESAVVVSGIGVPQVLDKPFQVARVSDGGSSPSVTVFQGDSNEILGKLAPLMRIAPEPTRQAVLHFQKGGVNLVPASELELARLALEAKRRPGAEIVVVGHTDTVGSASENDRLSLLRAKAVAALLVDKGVRSDRIEAVGRGEREPLVPTPDEVDEPENRRVELVLF